MSGYTERFATHCLLVGINFAFGLEEQKLVRSQGSNRMVAKWDTNIMLLLILFVDESVLSGSSTSRHRGVGMAFCDFCKVSVRCCGAIGGKV